MSDVVVAGTQEEPAAGVPDVLAVAVESAEPVVAGGHAPAPTVAGAAADPDGLLGEASEVPAAELELVVPCVVLPTAPEAVPPTIAPPLSFVPAPGALGVGESGPLFPTCASPVEVGELVAVASEVPVAVPEVPGVTVSTTAVVPAPGAALPDAPGPPIVVVPGVRVSEPASLGGSRSGVPTRAAIETSGPFFSTPVVRASSPARGRGVFCSCCMRASAPGSGCGTGAPIAISLALASPASGESG